MTRLIRNKVRFISIYLEEQYLEEIMEIRIEKFIQEKEEFQRAIKEYKSEKY